MSLALAELETPSSLAEVQVQPRVPRRPRTPVATWQCLVVSDSPDRRALLAEFAQAAGWQVDVFCQAEAAAVAAQRHRYALSIVDLDGLSPDQSGSFRSLTEQISAGPQPLVMVCGSEGDVLEEIWARQLGVWLYLAGVDPTCDLTSLCREAQQVAQQLAVRSCPLSA